MTLSKSDITRWEQEIRTWLGVKYPGDDIPILCRHGSAEEPSLLTLEITAPYKKSLVAREIIVVGETWLVQHCIPTRAFIRV